MTFSATDSTIAMILDPREARALLNRLERAAYPPTPEDGTQEIIAALDDFVNGSDDV